MKFSAFLRDDKEQAPRSVYNKFENVMTFLKANGIRGLVGKLFSGRFNQPKTPIFPESEPDYFLKGVHAQVTFVRDAPDRALEHILRQVGDHAKCIEIVTPRGSATLGRLLR